MCTIISTGCLGGIDYHDVSSYMCVCVFVVPQKQIYDTHMFVSIISSLLLQKVIELVDKYLKT